MTLDLSRWICSEELKLYLHVWQSMKLSLNVHLRQSWMFSVVSFNNHKYKSLGSLYYCGWSSYIPSRSQLSSPGEATGRRSETRRAAGVSNYNGHSGQRADLKEHPLCRSITARCELWGSFYRSPTNALATQKEVKRFMISFKQVAYRL